MKTYLLNLLSIPLLLIPSVTMAAVPGEGVILDPATGDYLITYVSVEGNLRQSRFVPSTKIDPEISSMFEYERGWVHYRYRITNGKNSKQPLISLIFDRVSSVRSSAPLPETTQEMGGIYKQMESNKERLDQIWAAAASALESPRGWSGEVVFGSVEESGSGYRLAWSFDDLDETHRNGLQPGKSLSGFGVASTDLPGINMAQLSGFGDMGPSVVEGGPDDDAILEQIMKLQENDFVTRPAAVPAIAVPAPFDAAVLLERIQAEMHTWPGKQMLDPAFSAQLDRYFQSAIGACRLNQRETCKKHIQTLRALIKKEQPDADKEEADDDDSNDDRNSVKRPLIGKLAARVLDFDLRYVVIRMGDGEDD